MSTTFTSRGRASGSTPDPTAATATGDDDGASATHPGTGPATDDGPDRRMFCYGCRTWRERTPGWDRGKCPCCQMAKEESKPLYDNAGNLIKTPKKRKPKKTKAEAATPAFETTEGALK